MTGQPGDARTSAVPSAPSKTTSSRAAVWPDADVSVVAFRFHALGGTERATDLLLSHLANTGVRNVRRYVDGITDDDLNVYLRKADDAAKVARHATHGARQRRGDLLVVRPARWPWPVTSGGWGR